jgi:hypothetical protein
LAVVRSGGLNWNQFCAKPSEVLDETKIVLRVERGLAMGEVVIELPFDVKRRFRIGSVKAAAEILEQLENMEKKSPGLSPHQVADDDVLTVWADRTEPPDEIARQLRRATRQDG